MTLGSRNEHLLALRELLFGATINAVVPCPACRQKVEFAISIGTMVPQTPTEQRSALDRAFSCDVEGITVPYRLLCSYDVASLPAAADSVLAQERLTRRALLTAPDAPEPSQQVLDAVADAIVTTDSLADITLSFTCAACRHAWTAPFDIVSFLWNEIDQEVRRLFDDVHRLSTSYGWSEAIVLSMSAQRRREYLSRAS